MVQYDGGGKIPEYLSPVGERTRLVIIGRGVVFIL
jgi:hypothetical protein